jgi:nitroreductase
MAMNVLEAIEKRRSVRSYRPDPIPEDVLHRLLNAMRLAPSGGNRQAWKFVVVREGAMKRRLAEACTYVRRSGEVRPQLWIAEAPVVIVACGSEQQAASRYYRDGRPVIAYGDASPEEVKADKADYESCLDWDLAIALDHLTLAAVEEGLGTCWIGGLDERKVKGLLSIPDDWRAPLAMPVGYPVERPEPRSRKPLEEIVCYERFS